MKKVETRKSVRLLIAKETLLALGGEDQQSGAGTNTLTSMGVCTYTHGA